MREVKAHVNSAAQTLRPKATHDGVRRFVLAEFVGGPWDGQVAPVDVEYRRITLHTQPPPGWFADGPRASDPTGPYELGDYQRRRRAGEATIEHVTAVAEEVLASARFDVIAFESRKMARTVFDWTAAEERDDGHDVRLDGVRLSEGEEAALATYPAVIRAPVRAAALAVKRYAQPIVGLTYPMPSVADVIVETMLRAHAETFVQLGAALNRADDQLEQLETRLEHTGAPAGPAGG